MKPNRILLVTLLCNTILFCTSSFSVEKANNGKDKPPIKSDAANWQGFVFGITEDQLLSSKSQATKLPRRLDGNYQYADYGIFDYQIAGKLFDVAFYFGTQSKLLDEIVLNYKKTDKSIEVVCGDLKTGLSDKYGQPLFYNKERLASGDQMIVSKWASSKIYVELDCHLGYDFIYIRYKPKAVKGDSSEF